ncbi:zinc finger protein 414 isoform X2 [Megalops cyprinoides]|nr:zinc finger protein 414 isoform X2 [Megalops cyprinoides]XP_036410299.1 zinc finger protein 414 isoform X2 [Megalops cyprinoides]XP_036410300.1 zinc finger protein 414 isoform X2 [Megalops cyprinoides]
MSAGIAACEPAPAPGPQASASTAGSRLPCSFYGCKQSFTDIQHLNKHAQSHQIPTQSLPGKVFHCSSLGCNGTFPSMQHLMEHMRHHYKPNHYFLCESCRAKLRSYRALFKHLHTCAKVAKSKAARAEELNPAVSAPEAAESVSVSAAPALVTPHAADPSGAFHSSAEEEPMDLDHAPPPAVASPVAAAPPIPSFQAPVSSLLQDAASTPPPGSFSLLEPTVFPEDPQHFLTQTQPGAPPSSLPPGPAAPGQQQRPIRAVAPISPAPPTPLGSNAVWKKNQGQSFSSRILWEHTRGRYSCLQCGHCTPSRQEMTAHIEGQHRSPAGRPHGDTDVRGASPPFQPKASLDTDTATAIYTQL